MRQPLEALRLKRRLRDINHAKLARMLECAELNVPASWMRERADLSAVPGLSHDLQRRKGSAVLVPKKARWILVPAAAAAAVLILFMTGIFDFMHSGHSGTAGIVSGDVVVRRDGTERMLHAGDAVVRR